MFRTLNLFIVCAVTAAVASSPPARAADAVDYHVAPPSASIQPYAVPEAKEPQLAPAQLWPLLRSRVKYVFVIYQENRSFDSYFGTFPGADGLFSSPANQTPGFHQKLVNIDGTMGDIHPFRIGPAEHAADTEDIGHSHPQIVEKMHVVAGQARMDHVALVEERRLKPSPSGNPTLAAKQLGELTMAYEDGDTIPLLWRYADRFVLCDHIFQLMAAPSTPGNLAIIAAQAGQTQWVLHPDQAVHRGGKGGGVPVVNSLDPLWSSPPNAAPAPATQPGGRDIQINLTFASLPLTLQGASLQGTTGHDANPTVDLQDVRHDIPAITQTGKATLGFAWYQEGYGQAPHDAGPTDAQGRSAAYITHHNGPLYFGYIANNPELRRGLHPMEDFFADLHHQALPPAGGLFFVKGGFRNILGLTPASSDPAIQKKYLGDDDHPGYSDAQISEAMVAHTINAIAASTYWSQCAIIITWDDCAGAYDHMPPPIRTWGPDGLPLTNGPRVPMLMISPFARVHYVCHSPGNHASVVKFVDHLFDLIPLANLPDELHARQLGKERLGQSDLGPADAITPDVTDLLDAFDPARLSGAAPPLPVDYVTVPDKLIDTLPAVTGYGCKDLGITPVDSLLGIKNEIPPDFNPRPVIKPKR